MSEEAQDKKEEQEAQENQETPETQDSAESGEDSAGKEASNKPGDAPGGEEATQPSSQKKKKINRLTIEDLNSKIEELEKKNQTQALYYKHLVDRKKEIEAEG